MEILNVLEKVVSIICPIIAIIISIISFKNSEFAIKKVNNIKIGNNEKTQEAINNSDSNITQNM